jgi:hypothetical protein
MAKPIPIRNSQELAGLLKALVDDIRTCHDYYRLYRKLHEALKEFDTEFHQSPAFWSLTFQSLGDAAILRLCRVYDQHKSANHLHGLLLTIQANPELFDEAHFRERLQDNPAVDYLAKHGTSPKPDDLEKDLKLTSDDDPDVLLLYKWRGAVVAHRNAKMAKGTNTWADENPLSWAVIEKLIDRAFEIFNKYSVLFSAASYSTMLIGEDDYKDLLQLLRLGLKEL